MPLLRRRPRDRSQFDSDITKDQLQYRASDNAMVYALFSVAFAPAAAMSCDTAYFAGDYDPDFLDNFEFGFKSRWPRRPHRSTSRHSR